MVITITTVTTVTTIAALNFTSALGMVATIMLLVILVTKQIVASTNSSVCLRIGKALNVSIIPLSIILAVIFFARIVAVLA
ncbi:hypothetical protein ACFLV3_06520 [Chloroflexota bacterium]